MKKIAGVALVSMLLFTAAGFAEYEKTKIAVFDFELKGEGYATDDMGEIVAEWFVTALVKEGRFDVIERSLLNKILEEQKLSLSGVIDESTATEIGKLLGVSDLIHARIDEKPAEIDSQGQRQITATVLAEPLSKRHRSTGYPCSAQADRPPLKTLTFSRSSSISRWATSSS